MKVKDFWERLPGSLSLTFLMFPRFGVFAVMRSIFPFKVLFLVLPAVEIIPDLWPGHIGSGQLLALARLFVSCTFHKIIFGKTISMRHKSNASLLYLFPPAVAPENVPPFPLIGGQYPQ